MKTLNQRELILITGGNDGDKKGSWLQSIFQPFKDLAEGFNTLYSSIRESVIDWGHTDGCKELCSQK